MAVSNGNYKRWIPSQNHKLMLGITSSYRPIGASWLGEARGPDRCTEYLEARGSHADCAASEWRPGDKPRLSPSKRFDAEVRTGEDKTPRKGSAGRTEESSVGKECV